MASSKDLFAPPSQDELKLAPAPKANADLFAPPADHELESVGVKKKTGPGVAQTALEHGGNMMTLGYLPQIQAAAEPLTNAIGNLLTGSDVKNEPYVKRRDENIKRLDLEQEVNPKTALASQVGGGLIGAIATPLPEIAALKGAGLLSAAGRGAAAGTAYGAAMNPGDVEGEVSPVQALERMKGAGKGAVIGAGAGSATAATAKGLTALSELSPKLKSLAEMQAFKSSGAMLKDFRSMGEDKIKKLGRWMLDNGLSTWGDDTASIAEKAASSAKESGSRLSKVYQEATQTPLPEGSTVGFNPVRDKATILARAKESLGDAVDGKGALSKLSDYLDELGEKYGDNVLDPKISNDIKGAMDSKIKYSRNPLSPTPDVETAFRDSRGHVASSIDSHIDEIGKQSFNSGLADELRSANKTYGNSKTIKDIAQDRTNREGANRMFGLTDTIAGGAGGVAGAAIGSALGGDDNHKGAVGGAGSVGGFLIGALANKLGRKYGPSTLAKTADALSVPAAATRPLGAIAPAIENQALTRALIEAGLLKINKDSKSPSSAPAGLLNEIRLSQ